MYNNFIQQKKINQIIKAQEQAIREDTWKRKYNLQIRPHLIDHYEKRVTSFIRQVDDKPIKILSLHQIDRSKSMKQFVYRDKDDWKSFNTTISKKQGQSTRIKLHHKKQTYKQIQNNHPFQDSRQDFRPRNKQLQIHRPMAFDRPHSCLHPERRQRSKTTKKIKDKNISINLHSQGRISASLRRNESNGTLLSTHYDPFSSKNDHHHVDVDYFRQSKIDNIEIQAQIYEKQQEIVQKKYHFKKLLNMSLVSKSQTSRKDFRKILEKNGYINVKKTKLSTQNSQFDHFSQMVMRGDDQLC